MIQQKIKQATSDICDLHPSLFFMRGKVSFPQGFFFLREMFAGKTAADVYAHPYFIDRNNDPTQPSPQMHLTEELQALMQLNRGLFFTHDQYSKLDQTMTVAFDDSSSVQSQNYDVCTNNLSSYIQSTGNNNPKNNADWSYHRSYMGGRSPNIFSSPSTIVEQNSLFVSPPEPVKKVDVVEDSKKGGGGRVAYIYNPMELTEAAWFVLSKRLLAEKTEVRALIVPNRQGLKPHLSRWLEMFPTAMFLFASSSLSDEFVQDVVRPHIQSQQVKNSSFTWEDKALALGEGQPHVHHLFSGAALLSVPGDSITNEFLLLHEPSRTLSCTDLFHGMYSDFDTHNSWMTRAFFKFQRDGDYKNMYLLPDFKKKLLFQQGVPISKIQEFIEHSIQNLAWDTLIFSHGTPPLNDNAKDVLRIQWGLDAPPREVRVEYTEECTPPNFREAFNARQSMFSGPQSDKPMSGPQLF